MNPEQVDFSQFSWMNPPDQVEMHSNGIEFITTPKTDFWQRTHLGFRRNNGHAFLTRLWDDFTLYAQAEFFYEALFDQAGILLYIDEDNWAKSALEYFDEGFGQLGSVVTNQGYSDWACITVPITLNNRMYYRLSRRGGDFKFEISDDGSDWRQMRIFHMMGDLAQARVGIYACSPAESSFRVRFKSVCVGPCIWSD